nr:phosphoribosylaminoimidazolecarboxamide formyltransferase [uncultured Fretibacterium sp.]
MKELQLKYGCNPNQVPARLFVEEGELPFEVLNGRPGYINFLDALNGWQLVRELRKTLAMPAAASFKHVSPAGAALGIPLDEAEKRLFLTDLPGLDESPLACAYVRARGTDRMSSFGDWIALSDPCDAVTASVIRREVSDGVVAPGYSDEALAILREKRNGNYAVVRMDPGWEPPLLERRDVFGVTFEQRRNDAVVDPAVFDRPVARLRDIPEAARRDLTLALLVLKYTQSNSVCTARGGQTLGVGAGQQSRVHCTRLAGDKTDVRLLRAHPKVLDLPFRADLARPDRDNAINVYLSPAPEDVLAEGYWQRCFDRRPDPLTPEERRAWLSGMSGVSLASDAFFPFPDNVERARRSGVSYIAQPGGSIRDDAVIEACDRYGIAMVMTGQRLFHH